MIDGEKVEEVLRGMMYVDDKVDRILSLINEELDKWESLTEKYDEYLSFLNTANNGPISLAFVHGWRCPQEDIDKGELFRKEIAKLKQAIKEGREGRLRKKGE